MRAHPNSIEYARKRVQRLQARIDEFETMDPKGPSTWKQDQRKGMNKGNAFRTVRERLALDRAALASWKKRLKEEGGQ